MVQSHTKSLYLRKQKHETITQKELQALLDYILSLDLTDPELQWLADKIMESFTAIRLLTHPSSQR